MKRISYPIFLAIILFTSCVAKTDKEVLTMYVGTYGEQSYKYSFNPTTLESQRELTYAVPNGSYLTIVNDFVYAVSESEGGSAVYSFAKDGSKISSVAVSGSAPCYIEIFEGKIYTANYGGGSISVFDVDTLTGVINPQETTYAFQGSGPVAPDQTQARIHTVRILKMDSNNAYLVATDLGSDKLHVMKIGEGTFKDVDTPVGAGPRHIAFSENGKDFYVITELSGDILYYRYDNQMNCTLTQVVPANIDGGDACGDIHIHPSGKFLYGSNRVRRDGISVFAISQSEDGAQRGMLSQVGYIATAGHPRNFTITPDGKHLLCASKNDKKIQIFSIDPQTGLLTDTGKEILFADESPVCIVLQ